MKLVGLFFVGAMILFFSGCGGSPKNAYALKTADYGQCRSIEKGEKIFYKKRLVRYVCEDMHVLFGEPYEKQDIWYFKSGLLEEGDVKHISSTKVEKVLHKQCELEGAYGIGTQEIRKFYFNSVFLACKPFIWSGKAGIAPFNSKDECRVECFHLR